MLELDSPRSRASKCKDHGNRCFTAQDNSGALKSYKEGLHLLKGIEPAAVPASLAAALHANSAQVFMRQRCWLEAIEQCNEALRHDPKHIKAAWRGAKAALEVDMRDVAISFLENSLDCNPGCAELLELRNKLGPLPDSVRGSTSDDDEGTLEKPWRPLPQYERPQRPLPPEGKSKAD